ncbi:hypothetical protein C0J50_20551, partial [Silurus asotus]
FELRNISKLRNMLSISDAEKLVYAFMTSRIDYYNALLGGCPASLINKLQLVQNAAAKVLTRPKWFGSHASLQFFNMLQSATCLRSQNFGLLVVPRIAKSTKGGRSFSHLAPKLWNSLPDCVRGSDTLTQFKCRLKTYIFSKAY